MQRERGQKRVTETRFLILSLLPTLGTYQNQVNVKKHRAEVLEFISLTPSQIGSMTQRGSVTSQLTQWCWSRVKFTFWFLWHLSSDSFHFMALSFLARIRKQLSHRIFNFQSHMPIGIYHEELNRNNSKYFKRLRDPGLSDI